MVDVAKALSRPPTYPTKYFGCELGAQTQFDLKNDRFIVNGSHDANKLQGLLDNFIKRFVLCDECSNPETILSASQKNQTIKARCIACGHQSMVDMRHKLTTFILKNPPDVDPATITPSKGSKSKKGGRKGKKGEDCNGDDGDNDRASPEVNTQEQMANQRASGGVIDAPPEIVVDLDDDWGGEDVSDEAVAKRMQELTDAAKTMAMSEELEKTENERMNFFYSFVKEKIKSKSLAGADQEVLVEAERLEVKDKAALVLVELLMDQKVLTQIKQHRKLLLRFCHNNQKAQKYLLGGMEQLIGNEFKASLLPKVPHIFKELYDNDILEEEVLIDWNKKVSKKYVSKAVAQEIHDKATPFIKWLQEAEEEESDDDDDEVEVAFSTTGKVGAQTVTPEKTASPALNNGTATANGDEDEDDIDIDAI
ncbi:IF5-like protein [Mya arenaria]|uniref:Eukaryotic translation initiation factor 5 n=2 Tax=Mya arenaria TaxID=6604 RepID=A0ABY7FHL9_MYAAR|nr:IF5-like protein [Mya arenaria]